MDINLSEILYAKKKSPLEFHWDSLSIPTLYNYMMPQDIEKLYYIATSVRYNSKRELKERMIDEIMRNRDFRRFHAGTNRVVYKCLDNPTFIAKIAVDRVGINDNPAEYNNQFLLKPFVTKVFEVDPTGVIGTFERVTPILSKQEYAYVASDIYEMITNVILGKYVLEDIGSKYFMNMGIRNGFGPVLLDFPYVYELDGKKLYCNTILSDGSTCGGEIDYDAGFNDLGCKKCGKHYNAKDLEIAIKQHEINSKTNVNIPLKTKVVKNGKIMHDFDPTFETTIIKR